MLWDANYFQSSFKLINKKQNAPVATKGCSASITPWDRAILHDASSAKRKQRWLNGGPHWT